MRRTHVVEDVVLYLERHADRLAETAHQRHLLARGTHGHRPGRCADPDQACGLFINNVEVRLARQDGYDVRQFARNDLRDSFGMVLQDTWLYNGTIRENIRYGRLSATDDEVLAAAKAAQVDHFVRTLPDGYDTVLNEEATNISQGQKQLLTIARTIISEPRILIFDEATSSVDTRTELAIQKAMDHLMEGRTSFIIAHRLSTIRDADLILVMKDGDIVETGTHTGLLAKRGFYAELYQSQFADVSSEAV